jgi:hypothetical protein
VGKWAARLAATTIAPSCNRPDKTAKRVVLSVLAVSPEGDCGVLVAVPMPASPRTVEALDAAAVARSDADLARFLDRRARLVRWGWTEPAAEKVAARLTWRDLCDDRVSCIDCRHYRPGRCGNHDLAELRAPELGRDLAGLLQRCPGFASAQVTPPSDW